LRAFRIRTTKGLAIKIRNFGVPDIRRVVEIEENSSLDGDAGLYLEVYEEWQEGFLVAEREKEGKEKEEVIGFIVLVLTPEGKGRVFAIAVDSRYRGKGVGRALLKAGFSVLRKRKIGFVELEVRVSNVVAQRLYSSLGFLEVGFVPLYYKDGESAIFMRKVL